MTTDAMASAKAPDGGTPISVSTSTASSPRSPLGSACTTVTDGDGSASSSTLVTLTSKDLFVVPQERRGGIGSRLLTRLAEIAVERKCGRMEWSVLDWNTPARDLYFKLGAKAMEEWTVFRMTPDAFGRLARDGVTR